MTQVTCRLTVKNRDQLRNPTLGNRVWATFTLYLFMAKNGRVVYSQWPSTGPGTEFEYDCLVNCSSPFFNSKLVMTVMPLIYKKSLTKLVYVLRLRNALWNWSFSVRSLCSWLFLCLYVLTGFRHTDADIYIYSYCLPIYMFRFRLLLLCIIVLFIFIFTICTLSRCGLSTWIKVLIWLQFDCNLIARATAGLAESNGSLPPGLWLKSPAGWL